MLFSIFSGGDIRTAIIRLLLTIPVIILALSCHEAAHGWMAYKMGDRTAYNLGRVTLNPIKHLDPLGTLMMLVIGYGWAKPVPINTRYFKNPKKGMALTALAGPMSNLILGIIGSMLYMLTNRIMLANIVAISGNALLENIFTVLQLFFLYFGYMNLALMVFNLIPLPPFDGSRIFSVFLPAKAYFAIMQYERYILYAVLGVSFALSYFFNFSPVSFVANELFYLICLPFGKLFSLILL